jgi:dihydrofolate synthase/folylpolyglutamate synthase
VAHAPLDPQLEGLARETRERTRSRWTEAARFDLDASPGDPPSFKLHTRWGSQELALPGLRGAENSALALTAFELFGGACTKHLPALGRVRWPGRMQRIAWAGAPCPVYASGDHNPQGVESLVELLGRYPRRGLLVLAGIGVDKSADEMLERLSRVPGSRLFLTETPFKGRKLATYGPWLDRAQGAWEDPVRALQEVARQAGKDDLILVTGSLYLVGAILRAARVHI